jgi:hypothetical protein
MKLILLFIATLLFQSASLDLETVRGGYLKAVSSSDSIEEFNNLLSNISKNDDAIFIAYKGAGLTLYAKKAKKIKDKKAFFIEGVSFINLALSKSPNDIEIRCIRLGIQENSPKILRYKKKIAEDKQFLLNQYSQIESSSLKKYIQGFILQSEVFSEEEKDDFL